MKLFKDSDLKEEVAELDLGTVTAGEEQKYTYYVYNDSNAELQNIKFEVSHEEVKILETVDSLESKSFGKLVLSWKPSVTLKEGLTSILRYKADEIWSPKKF